MTATSLGKSTVIYPVVVVEVQEVKCRTLLDTDAGNSNASAALIDSLKIKAGIVELLTGSATGQRHFYILHKRVVRESAETTKFRVVYDASARTYSGAPSLNECLNPRPPLQNKLWSVLVHARLHPIVVTGDIKQAFLQV